MAADRSTESQEPSSAQIISALAEVSDLCATSPHIEESLPALVKLVASRLKIERCIVTLLERSTGELVINAAYGMSDAEKKRGRYAIGEGITGRVVRSGRGEIIPVVSEESSFLARVSRQTDEQPVAHAFICIPLKAANEVIGTLSALSVTPKDHGLLQRHSRFLGIVASLIAGPLRAERLSGDSEQRPVASAVLSPSNIVGRSKAMELVYDLIAQVSASDTTVLLQGESGVGKELVAHAIHERSGRQKGPFVKLNCAALPASMLESELFGHEKGAFTGALQRRKGRFELADKGTIFLDEIGDISAATQISLLRVLQEKEFERVGGSQTLRIDARVITATNRDLAEITNNGNFREDLFYRLNVFPIQIPPLRERQADILLLADFFVEKYASAMGRTVRRLSTSAIDMLIAYHWPGNVRELENCIERAVLISDSAVIQGNHLPPSLQTGEASGTTPGSLKSSLAAVEKELLLDALKTSRGNMASAARQLGISERIMGLRVKKYDIDTHRFNKPI